MLRHFYTVLLYLATPIIILRLLWKARRSPAYLHRWGERFGVVPAPEKPRSLCLHAVSVGEVIAAVPLIKQLLKTYPEHSLVVTTMTPTGSERVQELFNGSVEHVYVPYDLPDAISRFLNRVKPEAVIIMETEIWPNFLHALARRQIPVLLANARLSPRSTQGYSYFHRFIRRTLKNITVIAAQSQSDAERFQKIGATTQQIQVTGNIKFDLAIPASTQEKAAVFQSLWGTNRLVWVAASTHEGEEELILKAFADVCRSLPDVLLVLVPRHPERFSKVATLCRKQGYEVVLRSENQACPPEVNIFIGDSMGELAAFYAASDVAFVGGSLVPTGGHNLLEPAALGIAAITGPHVFNFVEITDLLLAAGAIEKVADEKELATTVIRWLQDSTLRSQAGSQGRKVVTQNRGAVDAHMDILARVLPT